MGIFEILANAKQMGFDIGHLLSLGAMYFMLRKDLIKIIDTQLNKLISAINSLEKAHNDRLDKIEAHVGLKKQE